MRETARQSEKYSREGGMGLTSRVQPWSPAGAKPGTGRPAGDPRMVAGSPIDHQLQADDTDSRNLRMGGRTLAQDA